jgi:putative transposase
MIKPRPALFKWRHFEPDVIVCAVRWYLRFSLSYRDVEELLMERGLPADQPCLAVCTVNYRVARFLWVPKRF